jgi:hypothetical protein
VRLGRYWSAWSSCATVWLFGGDVEAVGVALDRLEEPGSWVVELAQQGAGGDRRLVAAEDLLQRLGRRVG